MAETLDDQDLGYDKHWCGSEVVFRVGDREKLRHHFNSSVPSTKLFYGRGGASESCIIGACVRVWGARGFGFLVG